MDEYNIITRIADERPDYSEVEAVSLLSDDTMNRSILRKRGKAEILKIYERAAKDETFQLPPLSMVRHKDIKVTALRNALKRCGPTRDYDAILGLINDLGEK